MFCVWIFAGMLKPPSLPAQTGRVGGLSIPAKIQTQMFCVWIFAGMLKPPSLPVCAGFAFPVGVRSPLGTF